MTQHRFNPKARLVESLLSSVKDAGSSARSRFAPRRATRERNLGLVDEEKPQSLNWNRFLGRRRSGTLSEDDRTYFRERAETEIRLAEEAGHPDAARSHSLLAGYYLDLVHCSATAR
jgi:hypothetical protein